MKTETLSKRNDVLVRRLVLEPGEATPWHTDACNRFTVVVTGDKLRIEFRDTPDEIEVAVAPGMAGWDDPESRVHRAVNAGSGPYEEVVMLFLDKPGTDPQPAVAG